MNTWTWVPWTGRNLSAGVGGGQWGLTWFQTTLDTSQIAGTSGSYLVENNTDAYLYLGASEIYPGGLSAVGQTLLPPYAAAILTIDYNPIYLVSICAGLDFTTPRPPRPNLAPLLPRGNAAAVRVTALAAPAAPAILPPLRAGYLREYDLYDLQPGGGSIGIPAGDFWLSQRGDMTGAVSALCAVAGTAPNNLVTLNLYATDSLGSNVLLATTSGTQTGTFALVAQGAFLLGSGPGLQVINNTGAADVTLTDAVLYVGMRGGGL